MTQEEKELLLKDLCCRLPYGVITSTYIPHIGGGGETIERTLDSITTDETLGSSLYPDEKPYLRPMSSITKEEAEELDDVNGWRELGRRRCCYSRSEKYFFSGNNDTKNQLYVDDLNNCYDWLNAHHFDYRGLIEKGLALEAPKDMYKTQENIPMS